LDELGLFPLGLVLLPTERLPLHIFEERYKELVEECLEREAEFGLVYSDGDGIEDVGTRARVAEVLTRFEDGRLNVLVEGGERFHVDELTDGRSFHTAQVSRVDDTDDAADPAAIEDAMRVFGLLRDVTGSDVDPPDPAVPQLSFALAGKVELTPGEKLTLLRERSERRRIEIVQELLEHAVLAARRVRKAAERATTNGRVDLG
jgi:ATP-dependent Lon protease